MRIVYALATLALTACGDPRCKEEPYFCLSDDGRKEEISVMSDRRLLKIAVLDQRQSKPPGGTAIYELVRRGENRAKAVYTAYASTDVDPTLIDKMTRIFSRDWPVCSGWAQGVSSYANKNIRASCSRVFDRPKTLSR